MTNAHNRIKTLLETVSASDHQDTQRLKRVKTYWQIGRLCNQHKARTGQTVRDIAQAIGAHKTALQRYSQFNAVYPDGYTARYKNKVVKWHMFREVLRFSNAKEREFYLRQACGQDWDKYEHRRRIRADYFHNYRDAQSYTARNKLKETGQTLYTYTA